MNIKLAASVGALLISQTALGAEPTNQELLALIQKQQAQIEQLMKMVADNQQQVKDNKQLVIETDEKVEATADVIESTSKHGGSNNTTVGGYGELHYNNIDDEEEIDLHRFVLFFGHEFSDKIRFASELEVEHTLSGEGQPGEVELEQAYIEMDLTDQTTLKTGLFLVPVGITNETHEPTTFYGTERNPIEKNIIPTTWWEAGAAISTKLDDGLSADFAIHSGLDMPTSGSKAYLVRSGRQKVAEASADSLAYTARVKYTAIPGVELAASYQAQADVTQGVNGNSASLFSTHAIINRGAFGLKALYAQWNIEGSEAQAIGRDEQSGYFIEPSFKISEEWGIFARYNAWDNSAGSANTINTEKKQVNVGVNYWPHENVVFKFDLENRYGAQDGTGFNLAVGYMF